MLLLNLVHNKTAQLFLGCFMSLLNLLPLGLETAIVTTSTGLYLNT
nr:MAG TPA: hypothetical protein [Caudoviricetes sp.]